jgi:putative transposase
MRRAFKYKAALNPETERNARTWLGLCQQLYNAALEQRIDAYDRCGMGKTGDELVEVVNKKGKKEIKRVKALNRYSLESHEPKTGLGEYDQAAELKIIKQDFPEFKTVGSQVLKDVVRRLDRAYKAFFRRAKAGAGKSSGFPKFQGYHFYNSFTFPNSSGWKLDGRFLEIKNVGRLKLFPDTPPIGTIATVTVKVMPTGKWFVIFSCKDVPNHPLPSTGKTVGIDVGITHFATDSTGQRVENPRYYEQDEKRLRVLQRKLSRAQKGSKRREQVRLEVARLHERIANRRQDFACKLAHSYAQDYDQIAVEKLDIKDMTKRGGEYPKLPKKIHDAAWRQFHFRLESQCEDHGREFKQPPAAKTTMTCSHCGAEKEMPLNVRVYECPACGLVLPRTYNSALNIKAKAFE